MIVRKAAETLAAMARILRELPADIQVIDVFVQYRVVREVLEAEIHLQDGITTLADFYGKEIKHAERPGSPYTEFSIMVDGVKLFVLKNTTKGQ